MNLITLFFWSTALSHWVSTAQCFKTVKCPQLHKSMDQWRWKMGPPHCLEPLGNGHSAMDSKSQNNGVTYTSFFIGLIYLPIKETQFWRLKNQILEMLELKLPFQVQQQPLIWKTALTYGNRDFTSWNTSKTLLLLNSEFPPETLRHPTKHHLLCKTSNAVCITAITIQYVMLTADHWQHSECLQPYMQN